MRFSWVSAVAILTLLGLAAATEYSSYQVARPTGFSKIFYSEITSVEVQEASGKVVQTFPISDGGFLPQADDPNLSTGIADRNPDPRVKRYAHPRCWNGGAPDVLRITEDQYLVVGVRWKIAPYISKQLRWPAHIHVDKDFGWHWSVHNEVVPTNVWNGEDNTCPMHVGDPAVVKNKCGSAVFQNSESDSWNSRYCPGTKIACGARPSQELPAAKVTERSVNDLLSLKEGIKGLFQRLSGKEFTKERLAALGKADSAIAQLSELSDVAEGIVDVARELKRAEFCYVDEINGRSERSVFPLVNDDIMAADCPPNKRFCEGKQCIRCDDASNCPDMHAKIKGSKLLTMSLGEPEKLRSLGFIIHDAHGAGGDSMGMAHMMEPYSSLHIPIQFDGKEVLKPVDLSDHYCPVMKEGTDRPGNILKELEENVETLIATASTFNQGGAANFERVVVEQLFGRAPRDRHAQSLNGLVNAMTLLGGTSHHAEIRRFAWEQVSGYLSAYVESAENKRVFDRVCTNGSSTWSECFEKKMEEQLVPHVTAVARAMKDKSLDLVASNIEKVCRLSSHINCDFWNPAGIEGKILQDLKAGDFASAVNSALAKQRDALRDVVANPTFKDLLTLDMDEEDGDEPVVAPAQPQDNSREILSSGADGPKKEESPFTFGSGEGDSPTYSKEDLHALATMPTRPPLLTRGGERGHLEDSDSDDDGIPLHPPVLRREGRTERSSLSMAHSRLELVDPSSGEFNTLTNLLKDVKPFPYHSVELLDKNVEKEEDGIEKALKNYPPLPPTESFQQYEYDWGEENMLEGVIVELNPADLDKPTPSTEKELTTEDFLGMLEDEKFVESIVDSLKNLYSAKHHKYRKLLKSTRKELEKEKKEHKEMKNGGISDHDLSKMFPLIPVNQAREIKLKDLHDLALSKYDELDRNPQVMTKQVRDKLRNAVENEVDGIVSIDGGARAHIRRKLTRTLYMISKGFRPFMDSFLNMVFTGGAGVGKTKLAKSVGFVYSESGILLKSEMIVASPKDMIGQYIGETAGKTAGVLMKGIESIVFVDEAYQLMPCSSDGELQKKSKSFGPEAITEIVNFLDKHVGLSIMIVAGYKKEIDNCFLAANQGLPRRFPVQLNLPDYSINDLLNIFTSQVEKQMGKSMFDEPTAHYIYTIMTKLKDHNPAIFRYQAGDIMNMVSMFTQTAYSGVNRKWEDGQLAQVAIINETFNKYLQGKGLIAKITGGASAIESRRLRGTNPSPQEPMLTDK